jgi:ATPase subunit of ABC transporter with duplicated ATPase domains
MKCCGKCKIFWDEDNFSYRKGKLQSYCKNCQNKYSEEYRVNERNVCRENLKAWRKENKSNRNLTEKQKSEEKFRAKMRRFAKCNQSSPHPIFGYSSKELKSLAKKIVDSEDFLISYRKPLSEFDLNLERDQKLAASLNNLVIKPLTK